MFPHSHACYNVIDGRIRKLEIDTEMDTEMHIYGHIAVANVATSPIRSRLAMKKVATAWGIPFGFRTAMGRKGAAVAAAFHR